LTINNADSTAEAECADQYAVQVFDRQAEVLQQSSRSLRAKRLGESWSGLLARMLG
jgi:hypothetical protein